MTVVCFGDSVTYGHGLEDCYDVFTSAPGKTASKLSWPAQLGMEYVNRAVPGCSNKHIARRVADYNFQEGDTCIIMWTYLDRWSILDWNDEDTVAIGPWMTTKKHFRAWQYYKHIYDEFDSWYSNLVMIDWVNRLLEDEGIRHFNLWNNHRFHHTMHKIGPCVKWFNHIDFIDIKDCRRDQYSKALDNLHPGPLWQKAVAEKIAGIINE